MQAFERAAEYCSKLSGTPQDRFVESLGQELETEPPKPLQRLIMTWEEVQGLALRGHTVGSHTMTHPNVAQISQDDVQRELGQAKHRLEQELGIPIAHFSYPCPALQPHWAERTVSAARELGYQTAVTVDRGVVRADSNPFSLPRIRPTKTVDGLRWNLESAFLARNV
jgi:peptidoglycan/xylan/chitin deacetylase (PgdA/CDA1 family)